MAICAPASCAEASIHPHPTTPHPPPTIAGPRGGAVIMNERLRGVRFPPRHMSEATGAMRGAIGQPHTEAAGERGRAAGAVSPSSAAVPALAAAAATGPDGGGGWRGREKEKGEETEKGVAEGGEEGGTKRWVLCFSSHGVGVGLG